MNAENPRIITTNPTTNAVKQFVDALNKAGLAKPLSHPLQNKF